MNINQVTINSRRCSVCHENGHTYMGCNHPSIEDIHEQGVKRFHKHAIMNRKNRRCKYACNEWINNLSKGMMRLLLLRYAPAYKKVNYQDIYSWRMRGVNNEGEAELSQEENEYEETIPESPRVVGSARISEIKKMVEIAYNELGWIELNSYERSIMRYEVNTISEDIRRVVGCYRRNLSNLRLTREGLTEYTNQLTTYLHDIIQENNEENNIREPIFFHDYIDNENENENEEDVDSELIPMPNTAEEYEESVKISVHLHRSSSIVIPEDNSICGICWDVLTPNTFMQTDCKHNYCNKCIKGCIRQLLVKNNNQEKYLDFNCAICRREVDIILHNTDNSVEEDIKVLLNGNSNI